jgi:SPX domain protein involved in polyphosphate accumulation
MILKFDRKEYKYYAAWELLEPLRERFMQYMECDPFCKDREGKCYNVRSIYFDTPRLLFYNEKLDGVKIRKKLRVRVYNTLDRDSIAFLEIKRKYNNTVFKERVKLPLNDTLDVLNGAQVHIPEGFNSFTEAATLEKFRYLIKRLNLQPTILVTYEREALVGIDDPAMRVTFDMNVRSYSHPQIEEIYREEDLTLLKKDEFILEIKFNGRMPVWVRNIIRDFKLHIQAISKYCNGIDAWGATGRHYKSLD